NPLPVQLVPTTGQEGAFLQEPVPYVASSIFSIPFPLVQGINATIGVKLHNPFSTNLTIASVDFLVSGLNIGGSSGNSIGHVSNVTLGVNETRIVTVNWVVSLGGHHCVVVVLIYPDPTTQTLQKNFDIIPTVIPGASAGDTIEVQNPYPTPQCIDI